MSGRVEDIRLEGATIERAWTVRANKSMGVTLTIHSEAVDGIAPTITGLLWWNQGQTWCFRCGACSGEGVTMRDAIEAFLADRRQLHREELAMLRSHFGPDPALFDDDEDEDDATQAHGHAITGREAIEIHSQNPADRVLLKRVEGGQDREIDVDEAFDVIETDPGAVYVALKIKPSPVMRAAVAAAVAERG